MSRPAPSRAIALSEYVFQRLLRAYPRAHRDAYGEAMAQLFRDQCRDAWAESARWGLAKLWLRVLPDVVNTSIWEHLANLNPRKNMGNQLANLFRFYATAKLATFGTVFVIVFLLTVCVGTVITFILPESYASTARIKVERDDAILAAETGNPVAYDPYFLQTTFELMQSDLILNRVITNLNLTMVWGKKYYGGNILKTSEAMQILKGRISLMPIRNTKLISITAYDEEKNEAAAIANAVAEAYSAHRVESNRERIAAIEQQYQAEEKLLQADARQLSTNELAQHQAAVQTLLTKIESARLAARMPDESMVEIVDTAEPGRLPVKPNKPLNICISAILGMGLGTVAGGVAVLGISLLRRSPPKPAV